jgi:hypothetical protein
LRLWGCFDKELYEQRGVLTSRGIKKRAGVVFAKRRAMQASYQRLKLKTGASPDAALDSEQVSAAETYPETGFSDGFHFGTKAKKSKAKGYQDQSIDNSFSDLSGGISEAEISPQERQQAGELWQLVLAAIQPQVNRANYRTWLEKTDGLACRREVLIVRAPDRFVAEYLGRNLRSLVEKTLIQVSGQEYRTAFVSGDSLE